MITDKEQLSRMESYYIPVGLICKVTSIPSH